MTDQEINVAIALSQGWTAEGKDFADREIFSKNGYALCACDLPNYCNDLNAMHEAEKTLSQKKARTYLEILATTVQRHWHATAHQRAEAYLRTIGKWKD